MWRGWLAVVLVASCSSEHRVTGDAATNEIDAAIDAKPDAMADAMPDAKPDAPPAPPPAVCGSSPSVLVDVGTSRIGQIVRVADTLYISAYDYDNAAGESNGRLLTYDLVTGLPVGSAFTMPTHPGLWPGTGEAWMTDYSNGTIYRLVPGVAPAAVLSGRPSPEVATADGTYVYWSEASPPSTQGDAVKRRLIAGGTVEALMTCHASGLVTYGDDLYCSTYGGAVLRSPKTGGTPTQITGSGYPIMSMTRDADTIYFVTLKPTAEIYQLPMPSGPQSLVVEMSTVGRFEGLALSAGYIFVNGDAGVRRIDRTTHAMDTSYSDGIAGHDPVLWNGQLIFVKKDSQVLHCVDGGA